MAPGVKVFASLDKTRSQCLVGITHAKGGKERGQIIRVGVGWMSTFCGF